MTDKWDKRFLAKADLIASWSKDDVKVGAVIYTKDNRPVSEGRNGLPIGIADNAERYAHDDRVVIHAEVNAILFADRQQLIGSTIYVSRPTCANCAAVIIQAGITRVVYRKTQLNDKWHAHEQEALALYKEAGVNVTINIMDTK